MVLFIIGEKFKKIHQPEISLILYDYVIFPSAQLESCG